MKNYCALILMSSITPHLIGMEKEKAVTSQAEKKEMQPTAVAAVPAGVAPTIATPPAVEKPAASGGFFSFFRSQPAATPKEQSPTLTKPSPAPAKTVEEENIALAARVKAAELRITQILEKNTTTSDQATVLIEKIRSLFTTTETKNEIEGLIELLKKTEEEERQLTVRFHELDQKTTDTQFPAQEWRQLYSDIAEKGRAILALKISIETATQYLQKAQKAEEEIENLKKRLAEALSENATLGIIAQEHQKLIDASNASH